MIEGKKLLLTGGAGSVGSTLIPQLLDRNPEVLRVFDSSEPGLAELQTQYDDDRLRFLAGNVRDNDRVRRAIENIDVVIHTAAMKHVDISEYNPFEAVKTNAMGLQNVVDAAIDAGVKRFVFTSSDKAVDPANTMGTTKLLGEKLVTAGNKYSGSGDIHLTTVRFGNVINSSQSVIPLFVDQIRKGGPITLTDDRMTRFFLTYKGVFDLIDQAIQTTNGGEVFVYKMPAISIIDLAKAMIDTYAPKFGYDSSEIEIEKIGRRPGETFHEEIMTSRETEWAYENDTMFAITPESDGRLSYEVPDGYEKATDIVRSSKHAEKLSKEKIKTLLEENDVGSDTQ